MRLSPTIRSVATGNQWNGPVTTIIVFIILLLSCVICVFHAPQLGLLSSKGGHGIYRVRNTSSKGGHGIYRVRNTSKGGHGIYRVRNTSPKGGFGIFDVRNDLSPCCAQTGILGSVQVLLRGTEKRSFTLSRPGVERTVAVFAGSPAAEQARHEATA